MRADGLNIEVRQRAPWEAVDLGVALVRRHGRVIWSAWIIITGSALLLTTAVGYALELPWLGGLMLWWLKPVFDRIPLYVISRAVVGAAPDLRATLRAQATWGWRGIWPWLFWRRLHPGRCLRLPVDLLEQPTAAQRGPRVRVLSGIEGAPHLMLTLIGAHIEAMLSISVVVLALMFVPFEFLDDSAKAVYDAFVESPPVWMEALQYAVFWLAMCVIEPFYVGGGFGLYLNRRTQLEAWDIELAFRRMARRMSQVSAALCLALAVALVPGMTQPASATVPVPVASISDELIEREAKKESDAAPLQQLFGEAYRDDAAAFGKALEQAYADPLLSPRESVGRWRQRSSSASESSAFSAPGWLLAVAQFLARLFENMGWILLAVGLLALMLNYRRWWAWARRRIEPSAAAAPGKLSLMPSAVVPVLPADLPAAVEALWRQGEPRAALSLYYRGAVSRLNDLLGLPTPPGATEAECLRVARGLGDVAFRDAFVAIVRCWQRAAYAHRLPDDAEFRALLQAWPVTPESVP